MQAFPALNATAGDRCCNQRFARSLSRCMVAILGFFSAIWLSVFGRFLFGLLAGIILLYAVFCIATAVSLWRRKEWGVIGRHRLHLIPKLRLAVRVLLSARPPFCFPAVCEL